MLSQEVSNILRKKLDRCSLVDFGYVDSLGVPALTRFPTLLHMKPSTVLIMAERSSK